MTRRIEVRAPVRLDLAGGWTDVPPFSAERGGAVVNVTIDRYVHVELEGAERDIRLEAEDIGQVVEVADRSCLECSGVLALLQAAVLRCGPATGLVVRTTCDTPLGSGLGTSGALGTALIAACRWFAGHDLNPLAAADLAWRVEVQDCGIPGGRQDQLAAALGGCNLLEFHDPEVAVAPINLPEDVRGAIDHRLVLCYVGQSRVSGDTIVRVMDAYRRGDREVVAALDTMKRLAHDMAAALPRGDLAGIGDLLTRNWRCQMALDPAMQTDAMLRLERAVGGAGVLGGKAAGAGAGGCMFFLAAADPEPVRRAAAAAGATVLPASLAQSGVTRC